MITVANIGWSSYDIYEGPFFYKGAPFILPSEPDWADQQLAVITAAEGGHWNAINMYDRCIISVGLIQWCEGGQFSVSEMLGATYERNNSLLDPIADLMSVAQVSLERNSKGKWRFFFDDSRGEVDRIEEQRQLFLLNSTGKKGGWDDESKVWAKRWAAGIANVYAQTEAQEAQRDYTVPKLNSFAGPVLRGYLEQATDDPVGWSFTAAMISFAVNNPAKTDKGLSILRSEWKGEQWTNDWLNFALKTVVSNGFSIWPARYNSIRPVLEQQFGVDLPDHWADLNTSSLLGTRDIQAILVRQLGYDLGASGPNGDGVDGVWGPKTQSALADFERRRGLKADGLPDALTNDALKRARDEG